jgi:membrane-bound inhibitor of C-type lysozyme
MNWPKSIAFGAVMAGTVTLAGASTASAQTFQSYRCSDGTQFIVGFYPYDTRAHMQIDGREVTLSKRLALSGARYSGGGISLQITKAGITIVKHVKRSQTVCELM